MPDAASLPDPRTQSSPSSSSARARSAMPTATASCRSSGKWIEPRICRDSGGDLRRCDSPEGPTVQPASRCQDCRHGGHREDRKAGVTPIRRGWGRLTEEDEGRLLARVLTSRHVDVTVDLCEIEEVTEEGCTAIKNVAGYMGQDQTMVVLYKPDREATRSLERSGIADDGRIVFVASSPTRRISLAL